MQRLDLLPHQIEFVDSTDDTILVGGFGSGKSEAGMIKTIIRKMQYPQYKCAYYLPSYPLVRDIAFEKFTRFLEENGFKFTLNKSDKELHIDGYSSIIFRSMSEPENIVGYEVAYSLIDEADLINKQKMQIAYDKILGRNRAIEGANVDMVSTPEGFGFLYEKVNTGRFKVVRAKTSDNKFIPESYIESLKEQYSPELLRAYLNGEFVNLTSGTVYEYFNRERHHKEIQAMVHEPIYVGQDFNIGGCCSVVFVKRGNTAYAINEIVSNDTQGIVENLKELYPNRDITIYPDASGYSGRTNASLSDIDILFNAGFKINAPRANGKVRDRINTVNTLFSKNELFVNTELCPKLTKALEQQAYDKNGEPEKFSGAATIDDWNDALGYFIVREFSMHKPTVTNFRLSVG